MSSRRLKSELLWGTNQPIDFQVEFQVPQNARKEIWPEKTDENQAMGRLDKNFEWVTKAALRSNGKGGSIDGQIVGLRKSTITKECN